MCQIFKKMEWLNNFYIYWHNVSFYYIFTVILSILAVVFTFYDQIYGSYYTKKLSTKKAAKSPCLQENIPTEQFCETKENSVISKIRNLQQKSVVDQFAANLTEEQLQQERETESEQLEAIFNLLKNQADKFNVKSIEDLEDQMKLYRY